MSKFKFFLISVFLVGILICVGWFIKDSLEKKYVKERTIVKCTIPQNNSLKQTEKIHDSIDKNILRKFYEKTFTQMLFKDNDGNDNVIKNELYSPISFFMVSSMLAECCDNDSRKQLLNILGNSDMDCIRQQAKYIYESNCIDNEKTKSRLYNSIWFDEKQEIKKDTLDIVASNYYTSSYQGDMNDDTRFLGMYKDWLNQNTNNLLKKNVDKEQFVNDATMTLASTTYFVADWKTPFMSEADGEFNNGKNVTKCTKMYGEDKVSYFKNNCFQAIKNEMSDTNDGGMWFVLPKESSSVKEVIQDKEFLDLIMGQNSSRISDRVVSYHIPKFDVSNSDTDMIKSMKKLGVTDIFDSNAADFSKILVGSDGQYVTSFRQFMRLRIDKYKCEAASYDEVDVGKGSAVLPLDEEIIKIDFDRPFIFVLSGINGMPFYVGIINTVE